MRYHVLGKRKDSVRIQQRLEVEDVFVPFHGAGSGGLRIPGTIVGSAAVSVTS
jgi:hypothetical protein